MIIPHHTPLTRRLELNCVINYFASIYFISFANLNSGNWNHLSCDFMLTSPRLAIEDEDTTVYAMKTSSDFRSVKDSRSNLKSNLKCLAEPGTHLKVSR